MTKDELRKLYLAKRNAFSAEELRKKNKAIKALFFSRLMIHRYDKVHIYLPLIEKNEVDTRPIIDILLKDFPADVFVPKVEANGILTHHLFDQYTLLETNKWGIPEPQNQGISSEEFFHTDDDILVVVPLLAFDQKGNRVGYGKGFYDRFLANANPNTLRLGFSYFQAENEISDAEETDIPLNHVITPERVFSF